MATIFKMAAEVATTATTKDTAVRVALELGRVTRKQATATQKQQEPDRRDLREMT